MRMRRGGGGGEGGGGGLRVGDCGSAAIVRSRSQLHAISTPDGQHMPSAMNTAGLAQGIWPAPATLTLTHPCRLSVRRCWLRCASCRPRWMRRPRSCSNMQRATQKQWRGSLRQHRCGSSSSSSSSRRSSSSSRGCSVGIIMLPAQHLPPQPLAASSLQLHARCLCRVHDSMQRKPPIAGKIMCLLCSHGAGSGLKDVRRTLIPSSRIRDSMRTQSTMCE